ncbi:glutaredoxin [Candidatus Woesearchaeota archaeon]|jgi:glutathione S-transferase|nr:glutaredoxin [Candidatus Woesearchaeota archaeon]
MTQIKLYQFEQCPFCEKIRLKLEQLKIDYEKINVSFDFKDKLRQELKEKSNVGTVPVIEIEGKFIGESDLILKYLDEHF